MLEEYKIYVDVEREQEGEKRSRLYAAFNLCGTPSYSIRDGSLVCSLPYVPVCRSMHVTRGREGLDAEQRFSAAKYN